MSANIRFLCQTSRMKDDLSDRFREHLIKRGEDFDAFAWRHRNAFRRSFLEQILAGEHRRGHPALVPFRRLVAFEYDLRQTKLELGLSGRVVARAAGISPSRLSRFERFKADLNTTEKRRIERFLANRTMERGKRQKIESDKAVGRALHVSRTTSGLTQAALAIMVGMERKSIIRWEQGSPMPDIVSNKIETRLQCRLRP
jgi:transcriptional regulator with XRE-family HTH domain